MTAFSTLSQGARSAKRSGSELRTVASPLARCEPSCAGLVPCPVTVACSVFVCYLNLELPSMDSQFSFSAGCPHNHGITLLRSLPRLVREKLSVSSDAVVVEVITVQIVSAAFITNRRHQSDDIFLLFLINCFTTHNTIIYK